MRKLFIAMAVCLGATITTQAQKAKLGIRGGVNFSNVKAQVGNISSENNMRIGYHIGLLSEFGGANNLFGEIGLSYSSQGAKTSTPQTDTEIRMLNIPMWAKFNISGFRPKAGVQLGYVLNITGRYSSGINLEENSNEYEPIEFGVGIGAEFNIPNSGFFIDGTYHIGLTNFNKSNEHINGINLSIVQFYNRVFQLGLGYKF